MIQERKKFHLERYRGMGTRHECPSCGDKHSFVYYVDEDGQVLDKSVGRCNHEQGCGYHYTPSDYYKDNGQSSDKHQPRQFHRQTPVRLVGTIPPSYVERSLSMGSILIKYLQTLHLDHLEEICQKYKVGAATDGSIIYWQIDTFNRVRAGKIMSYGSDGHRLHGKGVNWVHSILKKKGDLPQDWQLAQCLFGQHLIDATTKTVAIVESEKTALICACLIPDLTWLATGGCGNLNIDTFQCLTGRDVVLFPDAGSFDKWSKVAQSVVNCRVSVSDMLEVGDYPPNTDVADVLLAQMVQEKTPPTHQLQVLTPAEDTLVSMMFDYPIIGDLVTRFDLEVV